MPSQPMPLVDLMTRALELYRKNAVVLIVASTIMFGSLAVASVAYVNLSVDILSLLHDTIVADRNPGVMRALVIVVATTLYCVVFAPVAFISGGYYGALIGVARGQVVHVADIFKGGKYTHRMLCAHTMVSVVVVIGIQACVIPGVLALARLWPVGFVVVDNDVGLIAGVRRATRLTKGSVRRDAAVLLFAASVYIGGLLTCGIGLVAGLPLVATMFAVAYRGLEEMTEVATARESHQQIAEGEKGPPSL